METKKSPKADLEKRKPVFLQISLIIALGIVYMAFEWSTPGNYNKDIAQFNSGDIFDEDIINTFRQKEPEPPKPKIIENKVLEAVDNDVKVDDIIIKDMDTDIDEPIDPIIFQNPEPEVIEEIPYVLVENKPSFKGGEIALLKWMKENTEYPEIAKANNSTGTVAISFVISPTGKVTNYKVYRSSGDSFLDEEALRVFSIMPDWIPGEQQGKHVPVSYVIPVKFVLAE